MNREVSGSSNEVLFCPQEHYDSGKDKPVIGKDIQGVFFQKIEKEFNGKEA